MGWLRDLMQAAEVESFGGLARAALGHPSWPSEVTPQPRSLATMFSRFDRGIELEWLSDRPAVQQVLAELLRCTVADVRAPLVRAEQDEPAPRTRLEGLPSAESFDYAREDLPPGVPRELAIPCGWGHLIWPIRPGSGRTLVRNWLDIRGRSEVCVAHQISDIAAAQTGTSPLFLDCTEIHDVVDVPTATGQRQICLVVDERTFIERPWAERGWNVVRSPAIAACVGEIVNWVARRLSAASKFDIKSTSEWLSKLVSEGTIETLSDVLGWCGYIADLGISRTLDKTPQQLLASAIRRELTALPRSKESGLSAVTRKIPGLLVAMAERALLSQDFNWSASQTLESWSELLPDEERVGPDLDWLRVHLTAASKTISTRDIERAAARVPPGAHRWLSLLRDALLLRPLPSGQFVLRPHYVARLCQKIAGETLLEGSAAAWGGALLGYSAPNAWNHLRRRVHYAPDALVDNLIEDLDEEILPTVAALDAATAALGLELLEDGDISLSAAEQILDETTALAVDSTDGTPLCRVGISVQLEGVSFRVLWWLSELALSEICGPRPGRPSALDPWHQKVPPPALVLLSDELITFGQSGGGDRPRWLWGAMRMMDRLREVLGVLPDSNGRAHPVHLPGLVLDEVQHGVLDWANLQRLIASDFLFATFQLLADKRRVANGLWARAFWLCFAERKFPLESWNFVLAHLELLRPHVPVEVVLSWLDAPERLPSADVLIGLPGEVILAWADHRDAGSATMIPRAIVEHAPEELLDKLLVDLEPKDEPLLPLFWARVPSRVAMRIHRFRVMLPDKAARWLEVAPVQSSAIVLNGSNLEGWLKSSEVILIALRHYCQRCIGARVRDWQVAYSWLVRIERTLRG